MNPSDAKRRCTYLLSYGYPESARETLKALIAHPASAYAVDDFGAGPAHDELESTLCGLLGKEAAVFMPAGRAAQLTALKAWAEIRGNGLVGMHPRCHILEYEDDAYRFVYGLEAVLLGDPGRPLVPTDLVDGDVDFVAAVVVEIPLLALGCVLPTWDDLVAISTWARGRGIPLHADGARLWEIGPHYGRTYAEISALFDSITVSFYKSLNGMAGGAVAGPADVIRRARRWQHRIGSAPFRMYPMVVDALRGLDENLAGMPDLYRRARTLAAVLSAIPRVMVEPNPPHSNVMHVTIPGDPGRFLEVAEGVSLATDLWIADHQLRSSRPETVMFAITVGLATLDVSDARAAEAITRLRDGLAV